MLQLLLLDYITVLRRQMPPTVNTPAENFEAIEIPLALRLQPLTFLVYEN